MLDGDLRDARAGLVGERGEEAVHLAVQPRLADDLRAVRLQRAAVVVQPHARDAPDQPVRDARRQSPRETVLPLLAPAGDDVVALVDLLEQGGDVGRVVLQVAVHRDDDRAARVVEAGGHRGRLSVVPAELDEPEPRVVGRERAQARVGVVTASVVDDHDLPRPAERVQRLAERGVERFDVPLLVVHRDDDRDLGRLRERLKRLLGGPVRARNRHPAQYADRCGRGHRTFGWSEIVGKPMVPPRAPSFRFVVSS